MNNGDVVIVIKTTQYPIDAGMEALTDETRVPGKFIRKGDQIYLFYTQEDKESKEKVDNRIVVDSDLNVTRTHRGQTSSVMKFVKAVETRTDYATPYGIFPMSFMTTYTGIDESDDSFVLTIEYLLGMEGKPVGNCKVEFKVNKA